MCAESCTVGPQQYMPTFLPAASSGANSSTDRVSVLNNFNAMLQDGQSRGFTLPAKAENPAYSSCGSALISSLEV
jgi:hypothetical protein